MGPDAAARHDAPGQHARHADAGHATDAAAGHADARHAGSARPAVADAGHAQPAVAAEQLERRWEYPEMRLTCAKHSSFGLPIFGGTRAALAVVGPFTLRFRICHRILPQGCWRFFST